MNANSIALIILGIVLMIVGVKLMRRGYFWKDRQGNHLSFKQFTGRYKEGVVNITPLQQTTTTLWAFIPMFAGIIWGIVVTLIGGTYWMSLILCGALPITSVEFIGNVQKYRSQKAASDMMKELEEPVKKKQSKKKRGKKKR